MKITEAEAAVYADMAGELSRTAAVLKHLELKSHRLLLPLQFLRRNSSGHNDGRPIEYYYCKSLGDSHP